MAKIKKIGIVIANAIGIPFRKKVNQNVEQQTNYVTFNGDMVTFNGEMITFGTS